MLSESKLRLLVCLADFDAKSEYQKSGWLRQKDITSKKIKGEPVFKARQENIPKYVSSLEKKGIVEKKKLSLKDERNRRVTHNAYRISKGYEAYFYISGCLFYNKKLNPYYNAFYESAYVKEIVKKLNPKIKDVKSLFKYNKAHAENIMAMREITKKKK
ncbi:hypothetical protein GOV05_00015 [Candidatus Woesearchaeota archaeon]|nr:hypothetical protein [Candidatus Woesearchaeota archaeon]